MSLKQIELPSGQTLSNQIPEKGVPVSIKSFAPDVLAMAFAIALGNPSAP
jgi:hypothetical protein